MGDLTDDVIGFVIARCLPPETLPSLMHTSRRMRSLVIQHTSVPQRFVRALVSQIFRLPDRACVAAFLNQHLAQVDKRDALTLAIYTSQDTPLLQRIVAAVDRLGLSYNVDCIDAVARCVRLNDVRVLRVLLASDSFYPAVLDNLFIRVAAERGATDVVALLLKEGRHVDPTAKDHEALMDAVTRNHADVVRLLLKHPKVSPLARKSKAIKLAVKYNRVDVVRVFVEDKRTNLEFVLRLACAQGQPDIVSALIDPLLTRFHPLVSQRIVLEHFRDALEDASANGAYDVVLAFIANGTLRQRCPAALFAALRESIYDVPLLLLASPMPQHVDDNLKKCMREALDWPELRQYWRARCAEVERDWVRLIVASPSFMQKMVHAHQSNRAGG